MREAFTDTEEKIINAAIQCIEKYGIKDTTIRKIAKEADVNSAAISYYFRNKDNLIEIAMEYTLKNAFDWNDFIEFDELPSKERVVAIVNSLIEGSFNFPGITRAHFYDTIVNNNYNTHAVKKINRFLNEMKENLKARGTERKDIELRFAIMQIAISTILFTALIPEFFEDFGGFKLSDKEYRLKYIKYMVDRLL